MLFLVALAMSSRSSAAAQHRGSRQVVGVSRVVTIRVRSIIVSNSYNDVAPKGPSAGDVAHQADRLVNLRRQFGAAIGATIGADRAVIRLASATSATVRGTTTLPGGTVSFTGTGRLASPLVARITGGTGSFAGAAGTVAVGIGDSPVNVYTLEL
jgi:hypothetical protein